MGRVPSTQKTRQCGICHQSIQARGFNSHFNKCKQARQRSLAFIGTRQHVNATPSLQREYSAPLVQPEPFNKPPDNEPMYGVGEGADEDIHPMNDIVDDVSCSSYISVEHHPHSNINIPTIISLNLNKSLNLEPTDIHTANKPWAPFQSLADFTFTQQAITDQFSHDTINSLLNHLHSDWAQECRVSFRTYNDMEAVLEAAKAYIVHFENEGSVSADFEGKTYTFNFRYRDPWEWILSLVKDPTLVDLIQWFPVRKYVDLNGKRMRYYDEPNTGVLWWEIQNSLPYDGNIPHCVFPINLWLDEGNVTGKTQVHPVLARAWSLPSQIFNGSGNAGMFLIVYDPIVKDPSDPDGRSQKESTEFARFKRDVYHRVKSVVLHTLREHALYGGLVHCADRIERVIYPLITLSVDGKEAWVCTCTRASKALFPCARCLVKQAQQHDLTLAPKLRTTNEMRQIFLEARQANSYTQRDKVLQAVGLHDTENYFWSFPRSDPYRGLCYDTLHNDDLGKWGKHLWPLLNEVLATRNVKGDLTVNLRSAPRWRNLKHFNNVTTLPKADGQDFLDIEKCILPAVVQLLPSNSCLVHCIHAHQLFRFSIGLNVVTEERISRIDGYIRLYNVHCNSILREYSAHKSSFDFPKQHATIHATSDIREKGVMRNQSTRPGEGFNQEAREDYGLTNGKNIDPQMTKHDDYQEVVARIAMNIQNSSGNTAPRDNQENKDKTPAQERNYGPNHWSLGAETKHWVTTTTVEQENRADYMYKDFDKRLRQFISNHITPVNGEVALKVMSHHCLYVRYTSFEDWRTYEDILRANVNFHGTARYDCVLINVESRNLTFARLHGLFSCQFDGNEVCDIALVRMFGMTKARPATVWTNCQLREELHEPHFILVKYVIRGALMQEIRGVGKKDARVFALVDTIDGDWFLRAGN